jgi:hypothetical protein
MRWSICGHYRGESLYENALAVTDGDVITAGATAPVDFAYHIFRRLDLYTPKTLDAWYGRFKTGDPAYYATLVQSNPAGAP